MADRLVHKNGERIMADRLMHKSVERCKDIEGLLAGLVAELDELADLGVRVAPERTNIQEARDLLSTVQSRLVEINGALDR